MQPTLQLKLVNRFSFYGPDPTLKENLMAFGFECGNGWFDLIWKLSEDIEKILLSKENYRSAKYPFEVTQVKEKFGWLRFYTNWATDEIYDLIDIACKKSYKICEECGKPGKQMVRGCWYQTLCKSHAKEFDYTDCPSED